MQSTLPGLPPLALTYSSRLRHLILIPTALNLLHLPPASSRLLTELATHLQRRMDGAQSASPQARAALANLPMTIRRV